VADTTPEGKAGEAAAAVWADVLTPEAPIKRPATREKGRQPSELVTQRFNAAV